MQRKRWAYLAAIFSCWGWASLYPAAELALEEVGPFIVVWARATVAGLTLSALSCMTSRGVQAGLLRMYNEIRAQPLTLFSLGTLAFGITSSLSISSQVFLPASVAALLIGIAPLWLALGTLLLGRTARPQHLIVGSLLACLGVGIVVFGRDVNTDGGAWWLLLATADWRGVALALTGSVAIAFAMVLARRSLAGRDAVAITAVACWWAAVVLTPVIILAGPGFTPLLTASLSTHMLLVFLGLGGTAFNFALWYFALSELPLNRIAHFQYLVPVLGVMLSVIILDENLSLSLVLGGSTILLGILVVQRGAGLSVDQTSRSGVPGNVVTAPLAAKDPSILQSR